MSKLLKKRRHLRLMVGSALVASSFFQLAMPVLAGGTGAGTSISNEASATYDDDNDPNNGSFTSISNPVTITVARVAGVTNAPVGFEDTTNNGDLLTGDTLVFKFNVTNTGNDVSDLFIPGANNIAKTGFNITQVQVQDPTNPNNFLPVNPATGLRVQNVAADQTLQVRVTGTVTATAAGAPISVRLGDTGSNLDPNAPRPDTQNQPDNGLGGDTAQAANEVRTLAPSNGGSGAPSQGPQREASALNQVLLGSNPLAFAKIEMTNGGVINNNGTPQTFNDDIVRYNLNLDVLETAPDPQYVPSDLEGRNYTQPGTGNFANGAGVAGFPTSLSNLILISDAVPANTTLLTAGGNAPQAPANWTVVYTNSPVGTPADQANWNTDPAAFPPGTITRVGWIYDAEANGPIARTAPPITGFNFNVRTTGLDPANGGTIANIAQVFGTTNDGAPGVSATPVFDESGDPQASNFNPDGTPGPNEDAPTSNGVANPAQQGTDGQNNNTGDGSPGGEANVLTVSPAGVILNGTRTDAAASGDVFGTGPDNNHDFQNQVVSTTQAEGGAIVPRPGTTYNPQPTTFTNTLRNPDPNNSLNGVLLQPIQPSFIGGTNTDLPTGTVVTIRFGSNAAIYTYNGTGFTLNQGSSPIPPINLAPGVSTTYTVAVNLPPGNCTVYRPKRWFRGWLSCADCCLR